FLLSSLYFEFLVHPAFPHTFIIFFAFPLVVIIAHFILNTLKYFSNFHLNPKKKTQSKATNTKKKQIEFLIRRKKINRFLIMIKIGALLLKKKNTGNARCSSSQEKYDTIIQLGTI
ncbi:hypothetical protein BpHYR1_016357, partial [Brachionus plicatilis]